MSFSESPREPDQSECCGSGCNPCIFDIYEAQVKRHKQQLNRNLNIDNIARTNCISPTSYSIFRLIETKPDSKYTNLYTFKYIRNNLNDDADDNNIQLIYDPGQHFLLRGTNANHNTETKYFTKAYTPITNKNNDKLSFTLLIKLYNEGKMSKFIKNLQLNSETLWRGPYGNYKIRYKFAHILMICQGTGIAPIYSIINDLVENEECETFLKLFYCCREHVSIHLRNEIYKLSSHWNFTYDIFLSQQNEEFDKKYKESIHCQRLTKDDIENYFQEKNCDNFQVLVCGSDIFIKQISKFLNDTGINENNIYTF